MLKGIFAFSGWNFIGATSGILKRHGNNLVLNLFFGTVVNAAYGLATQVTSAVSSFSSGIQNAINPQIIKQYSVRNMDYMFQLVFNGSRASFYLMMLVFVPVFLNTEDVLGLWLKEIPGHTTVFLQLSLITCMIETWSGPLITAMLATGDIKTYQLVVGGTDIMCLPLSYVCLRAGLAPMWVFLVMLIVSCVTLILRIVMLKRMISLPSRQFLMKIVIRSGFVCMISLVASDLVCSYITVFENTFWKVALNTCICVIISVVSVVVLDSTKSERALVLSFIKRK